MTQITIDKSEIIRMAREAGGVPLGDGGFIAGTMSLERFAQLVAAAERQAIEQAKEQEPVAVVDANDEGMWADILPDRSVKVGQLLYTHAQPAQEPLTDEHVIFAAQHMFLEWNRAQDERLVKVAYEYSVFQVAIELYKAAAHGIKGEA